MHDIVKYTFPNSRYNFGYEKSKTFFGQRFVTNKTAQNKKWIFANKIDYNSREVATENNKDIFKYGYLGREEIHKDKKTIFRNSKYERILYFSKDGAVRHKESEKRTKFYDKIKDIQETQTLACLYESFVSFENNFFNKNIKGRYTEEELFFKIKPQLESYILKNGFDLNNIEYFLSFHTNTDNFHFHFDFIEKVPTREKNKLKEKELGEIRKNIMFDLDEELKEQNYKQLENLQSLKKEVQEIVDNTSLESYIKLLDKGNKLLGNEKYRYYGDIKDKELLKVIQDLKVALLKEDKVLNNKLESYIELLEQKDEFDSSIYGKSSRRYSKKQIEEIDKRLNNKVFKELKKFKFKEKVDTKFKRLELEEDYSIYNYINENKDIDDYYNGDNKSYSNSKKRKLKKKIKKVDEEYFEKLYLINRNLKSKIYKSKKINNRCRKRIKEEQKVYKEYELKEFDELKDKYEDYKKTRDNQRFEHILDVHENLNLETRDITTFFTIQNLKYQDKRTLEKKISQHISKCINEGLNAKEVYSNGYLVKDSIMRINFLKNGKLPLLRKIIVKRNKLVNRTVGSSIENQILQSKINNYNYFIEILLSEDKEKVKGVDDKLSRQVLNSLDNEDEAQIIKVEHRKLSVDNYLENYLKLLEIEDDYIIDDIKECYLDQNKFKFNFFVNGNNKIQKFRTQKIIEEIVKKYDDFILKGNIRNTDVEKIKDLLQEYEVYKKYESKILESQSIVKFKHSGFVSLDNDFLNIEDEGVEVVYEGIEITKEEAYVFEKLKRSELYKDVEVREVKYEALVKIDEEEDFKTCQDMKLKYLINPSDEELYKSLEHIENEDYKKYSFINYHINKLNKYNKPLKKHNKFRVLKNINILKNSKDQRKYEKIKYLEDKYNIKDEDVVIYNLYLKKQLRITNIDLPYLNFKREVKRLLRKHQMEIQNKINDFERQITSK